MAAVQNRGRRHKWAIDFSHRRGDRQIQPTSDLPSPVGYTDKTVTDVSARDKDSSLVAKRAWDVALGPLKQLPMNLFIMYMSGNSISIFPIMMVGMMFIRPVQAFLSVKSTFKNFEGTQALAQKSVYLVSNLLALGLALYKCQAMGLLPTHSSDWLAFMDPQQRVEYSMGGMVVT
ncbi:ER membrane protein complex subunit 4-like [Branchiostoma floridae]|uniref:ER membrane protein complex subunit 4 n=1 Tax=Branchiostoma floridae TaxID=7739 RepID=C3YFL5_BRAFL|nr:ER membrane protein complex subunit 4-like [Branchiostoma floridae]|eukprot:XP_002604968.1 hypothetical protein BRAFLDRAFT_126700 [Branchiostoma floridae]